MRQLCFYAVFLFYSEICGTSSGDRRTSSKDALFPSSGTDREGLSEVTKSFPPHIRINQTFDTLEIPSDASKKNGTAELDIIGSSRRYTVPLNLSVITTVNNSDSISSRVKINETNPPVHYQEQNEIYSNTKVIDHFKRSGGIVSSIAHTTQTSSDERTVSKEPVANIPKLDVSISTRKPSTERSMGVHKAKSQTVSVYTTGHASQTLSTTPSSGVKEMLEIPPEAKSQIVGTNVTGYSSERAVPRRPSEEVRNQDEAMKEENIVLNNNDNGTTRITTETPNKQHEVTYHTVVHNGVGYSSQKLPEERMNLEEVTTVKVNWLTLKTTTERSFEPHEAKHFTPKTESSDGSGIGEYDSDTFVYLFTTDKTPEEVLYPQTTSEEVQDYKDLGDSLESHARQTGGLRIASVHKKWRSNLPPSGGRTDPGRSRPMMIWAPRKHLYCRRGSRAVRIGGRLVCKVVWTRY